MMRYRNIFALMVVSIQFPACSLIEPEEEISYTIQISGTAGNQPFSARSIWKVVIKDTWLSSPHNSVAYRYYGQAIPVKYNNNTYYGLLYSSIDPNLPATIIIHCLRARDSKTDWRDSWKSAFPEWKSTNKTYILPESLYPTFVHFENTSNEFKKLIVDGQPSSNSFNKFIKIRQISVTLGVDGSRKVNRLTIPAPTYKGIYNLSPNSARVSKELISISQFEKDMNHE